MPAFDIFLLPSITEAFGYVLLEAGYARIPVVASRVGGIPEIIEHEVTGLLVPPRDVLAIRSALDQLMNSPSLRGKLGSALHEKVVNEFSSALVISETALLYNKV
jgi:glycosyltransferase involved in cell wall biosynthesis